MKNTRIVLLLLIFSVIVSSFCSKEEQKIDIKAMEMEVLKYVNEFRVKNGKSLLVMNETIRDESRTHSTNMANKTVDFGHDGFDERTDRIWENVASGAIAENVAYNYTGAREAVDQWINSAGHKANMLGNYTVTGIGIAKNGNRYYFTQIFLYQRN